MVSMLRDLCTVVGGGPRFWAFTGLTTASAAAQAAAVLALLPVLGLCVGTMIGAEPLAFLLSPGPGRVLLALGFLFELAGLAWARALVRRAERG